MTNASNKRGYNHIDPSSHNFTRGQQQKFMNDKKQKKNKANNKLQKKNVVTRYLTTLTKCKCIRIDV
jgi:hypothetical protein